jgi:hypothetical protein
MVAPTRYYWVGMGNILEVVSVGGPVVLALMGVAMSVWPPKDNHWPWIVAFALVGVLTFGGSWKQINESDAAQIELTDSVNSLREAVSKLTIPVKQGVGIDPDAIYQNGSIVGNVIAPRITLNQSRIYFDQIQNAGNLDRNRLFQYRDYNLKFVGFGSYAGMLISSGGAVSSVYTNVVGEIIGSNAGR